MNKVELKRVLTNSALSNGDKFPGSCVAESWKWNAIARNFKIRLFLLWQARILAWRLRVRVSFSSCCIWLCASRRYLPLLLNLYSVVIPVDMCCISSAMSQCFFSDPGSEKFEEGIFASFVVALHASFVCALVPTCSLVYTQQ